jgi:hypothetical protein
MTANAQAAPQAWREAADLWSDAMMPYPAYQLYQIERAKSPAEIRRADEQLGRMAKRVSTLWHSTDPAGHRLARCSGTGGAAALRQRSTAAGSRTGSLPICALVALHKASRSAAAESGCARHASPVG